MTLTCHTGSRGTVSYSYLANGKEISHSTHGSTYTLSTTTAGTSISYTCTATISGATSAASSGHSIKIVGKYTKVVFISSTANYEL